MRYAVYKALVELSNSVLEATGYLKDNPNSFGVLADCEAGIIAIKDNLEANNEYVIDAVKNSLDKIYEIADCINANSTYDSQLSELYELVMKVNEYCKKSVSYKFRVVFFAELGAKWDSMDSVYRAYKDRDDCEVIVVIAPIFRAIKLPNGEVKSNVIYEDFLTPMGIQHIPFKEYDIKKDLPDLVFSSQPYESVTSEQFWAENIAPYTRLVYLPYFTAQSALSEEDVFVQSQMPMQKLAWRVICQSEKAKAYYSKFSDCKNFIATGLPKWDFVVNMDRRDIKMPKEWEKLKGKRVMLRNSHYNLGEHPEFLLNNTKKTLNEYQKYCGIIFRFHPMTDTMFKVYYPEYKEEWEKLLKLIDESEGGVVDRNTGYECAFKFSDFLLSPQSSIISQYVLTDKPMIIRDNGRVEQETKNNENIFIQEVPMGVASTFEEGSKMLEELFAGIDKNKEIRKKAKCEAMPNLDGNIGIRISELLIKEMLNEDNMLR